MLVCSSCQSGCAVDEPVHISMQNCVTVTCPVAGDESMHFDVAICKPILIGLINSTYLAVASILTSRQVSLTAVLVAFDFRLTFWLCCECTISTSKCAAQPLRAPFSFAREYTSFRSDCTSATMYSSSIPSAKLALSAASGGVAGLYVW